ncbi:SRPBCC family protein [Microvirga arabica]|uniref:SRPBCC family protein n=1 Tax=Microvirga arabica TaxID=1128671 RepID=UPI00193A3959|nr:SRPBCC family protein [Microvirga arabica]MBM1172544.1 SRPBCC family protein [Microvirga arabica]
MASETVEIMTKATPETVWDAIRDVGALHTRLVPGFVVDTRLEPGARIVTFGNGMIVREPIIALDEDRCRLVWSAEGAGLSHYNASVQVFATQGGSRAVWIADFLPDSASAQVQSMMQDGISVLKATMDKTAETS